MRPNDYRIQLIDRQPTRQDIVREVLTGLSQSPKQLPPKLFYDNIGSDLFEAITRQPEYYLTRAELAILARIGDDLQRLVDPNATIVELGSGSGEKTRELLHHLSRSAVYAAIDISAEALAAALTTLGEEFPDHRFIGLAADYLRPVALPADVSERPQVVVFFGSTLGNFEPFDAVRFLRRWADSLTPRDGLLIGIDLKKDRERLTRAYNDAQGVTAAFNRNVLTRINRECRADFDIDGFDHEAVYQSVPGRIAMFLISRRSHTVTVAGQPFAFAAGERLLTEYSYKYTIAEFHALADRAGWTPVHVWTDPENLFGLHYLRPQASRATLSQV
ncbi:MAG: L-histidine N(alpha)-methyltransferase [Thermaerobacter sp.]|nr:L-histidine N(alpha)-methyltransferase [Thermaerobacter sp.]